MKPCFGQKSELRSAISSLNVVVIRALRFVSASDMEGKLRAELGAIFTRLCEQVAGDLQRKGYVGKTIGIKLRYDNFKIATRDQTIDHYTADARTLRRAAGQCLKRVPLEQRLRLLGVRVGALARQDAVYAEAPPGAPLTARERAPVPQTGQLF